MYVCSSTNAYMLMYRRIDKQRNVCKFTFDYVIILVASIINIHRVPEKNKPLLF